MKINNLFKVLLLAALMSMSLPSKSGSLDMPTNTGTEKNDNERARRLISRLEEIRSMDTDQLTKREKKQLRKEVKGIKKELANISGGVYLSVGAIIIIILLLILLL